MAERDVQRLQEQWEKADQAAVELALGGLLREYPGRKLLWRMLQIGKIGVNPFSTNAMTTSFGCGELNVGQQILDLIISVDPAGYVAMMQENASERSNRDTELRDAASRGTDTGADSGS